MILIATVLPVILKVRFHYMQVDHIVSPVNSTINNPELSRTKNLIRKYLVSLAYFRFPSLLLGLEAPRPGNLGLAPGLGCGGGCDIVTRGLECLADVALPALKLTGLPGGLAHKIVNIGSSQHETEGLFLSVYLFGRIHGKNFAEGDFSVIIRARGRLQQKLR